jgi:hypothetical protein
VGAVVHIRWRQARSRTTLRADARVAELADAPDLGSGTARCVGSSPSSCTRLERLGNRAARRRWSAPREAGRGTAETRWRIPILCLGLLQPCVLAVHVQEVARVVRDPRLTAASSRITEGVVMITLHPVGRCRAGRPRPRALRPRLPLRSWASSLRLRSMPHAYPAGATGPNEQVARAALGMPRSLAISPYGRLARWYRADRRPDAVLKLLY